MNNFYYKKNGKTEGPFTNEELIKEIKQKRVKAFTRIALEEFARDEDLIKAKDLPGFQKLFPEKTPEKKANTKKEPNKEKEKSVDSKAEDNIKKNKVKKDKAKKAKKKEKKRKKEANIIPAPTPATTTAINTEDTKQLWLKYKDYVLMGMVVLLLGVLCYVGCNQGSIEPQAPGEEEETPLIPPPPTKEELVQQCLNWNFLKNENDYDGEMNISVTNSCSDYDIKIKAFSMKYKTFGGYGPPKSKVTRGNWLITEGTRSITVSVGYAVLVTNGYPYLDSIEFIKDGKKVEFD